MTFETPRALDFTADREEIAKHYNVHGFVHLRGILSTELADELRTESDRLQSSDYAHPDNVRTPYRKQSGDAPERMDPVCDISPLIDSVARDERILALLDEMFGGREPALFKDKLIFKRPGTNGYNCHQDGAFFPDGESASVSVQIDPATPENGSLSFFSGYHHELLTPAGELRNWTPEEEARFVTPDREYQPATEPGDVFIFSALTPHKSGRNNSTNPRRSLYLTYLAGGGPQLRDNYYAEYVQRFTKPGKFFK